MRYTARQARLSRLARQQRTDVVHLARRDATAVGRLLAASGTADGDDAHVVPPTGTTRTWCPGAPDRPC